MVTIDAAAFDPAAWLRAGDVVVFGQGMGEPVSLTHRLVAERARIGPLTCIVGALMSETFANGRSEGFDFLSYGALGGASTSLSRS